MFGVAHSFHGERIRTAATREYPRLIKDIRQCQEDRGLLYLIGEHIVDLGVLEFCGPLEEPDNVETDEGKTGEVEDVINPHPSSPYCPLPIQDAENQPTASGHRAILEREIASPPSRHQPESLNVPPFM